MFSQYQFITVNQSIEYELQNIQLIRRMDPRLYTYEYRRPRLSNPTYLSHNVNSSLTYYLNNPASSNPGRAPVNSNDQASHPTDSKDGSRHDATPASEQMQEGKLQRSKNRSSYLENGNKKPRYEENMVERIPQQYERQSSLPKIGQDSSTQKRSKGRYVSDSAYSNLSNYGSNVLNDGQVFKGSLYNDQEVFKRQDKKFNIITLKPNQYEHAIKQFPKLTLEDRDDYYYKKVQQQHVFQEQQARIRQHEADLINQYHQEHIHPQQYDNSAGKPTFTPNPQTEVYHANAKALKNLDQLGHI